MRRSPAAWDCQRLPGRHYSIAHRSSWRHDTASLGCCSSTCGLGSGTWRCCRVPLHDRWRQGFRQTHAGRWHAAEVLPAIALSQGLHAFTEQALRVLLPASAFHLIMCAATHIHTPAAALAAAAGPAARALRHRNIATLQTSSSSRTEVQQGCSFLHRIGAFGSNQMFVGICSGSVEKCMLYRCSMR